AVIVDTERRSVLRRPVRRRLQRHRRARRQAVPDLDRRRPRRPLPPDAGDDLRGRRRCRRPGRTGPGGAHGRQQFGSPAVDAAGGSTITGYRIYRGTAPGTETPLATLGAAASWDDTTVSAGTLYYYRVSAINDSGEGALSNEVSLTADLTVPIVPGGSPVAVT